jgi:hypothetical protein
MTLHCVASLREPEQEEADRVANINPIFLLELLKKWLCNQADFPTQIAYLRKIAL